MPQHVCPQCGASFYHRKSARIFCSNACRYAHAKDHPNAGTHQAGEVPHNKAAVGTVKIRQRHNRDEGSRAWVKVAEPNGWRLRAVLVWEAVNGPIPAGFVVHHRDRDTLNDDIGNLTLESRAAHLLEHRPEFEDLRKARAAAARRGHMAAAS